MLGALPTLGLAPPAFAQRAELHRGEREATPDETNPDFLVESWLDNYGRPTAKVTINGRGPFQFLVDTGATTTVIAERHVATLKAASLGKVTVIGATGSAIMPLVQLGRLQAGVVDKRKLPVAVLPDERLPREDGILGADVFVGRRLAFDIRNRIVRIEPTTQKSSPRAGNMQVRNGLLAEIQGQVGNIPTRLMLDTGANSSIANMALNDELKRRYRNLVRLEGARIFGVTGHGVSGQLVFLPKIDVQVFTVEGASCIAADASVFELWDLNKEPAMIVGVDLLSRLESFSIDYGARQFDAKLLAELVARNAAALG